MIAHAIGLGSSFAKRDSVGYERIEGVDTEPASVYIVNEVSASIFVLGCRIFFERK